MRLKYQYTFIICAPEMQIERDMKTMTTSDIENIINNCEKVQLHLKYCGSIKEVKEFDDVQSEDGDFTLKVILSNVTLTHFRLLIRMTRNPYSKLSKALCLMRDQLN
jgi:hypothetical protein